MRTSLIIVFCCLLYSAFATALAPQCDTLFTRDGKMYFVNYFGTEKNQIEYALCGDTTGQHYRIAKARVERIAVAKGKKIEKPLRDPVEKLARSAFIYALIGGIGIFVFSFIAVPFMIVGAVKGEKALRLLKKSHGHPQEEKIKRQSRTAILLPMVALMCAIGLYLLVLLFI